MSLPVRSIQLLRWKVTWAAYGGDGGRKELGRAIDLAVDLLCL